VEIVGRVFDQQLFGSLADSSLLNQQGKNRKGTNKWLVSDENQRYSVSDLQWLANNLVRVYLSDRDAQEVTFCEDIIKEIHSGPRKKTGRSRHVRGIHSRRKGGSEPPRKR